jgi:phosphatidate cytidylyltransferase
MLKTRVRSALILTPILIALVWVGGGAFALTVFGLLIVGADEAANLAEHAGHRPNRWLAFGIVTACMVTPYAGSEWTGAALFALMIFILLDTLRHLDPLHHLAFTLLAGGYVGGMGQHINALRHLYGLWPTLIMIGAVIAADVGAYTGGRLFGKRKMAPRISPGKTWEGYAAGIFAAATASVLLARMAGLSATDQTVAIVIGPAVGLLAPIGDLGISALKRQAGVKDTGRLIPGHGGILDRLDSVLIAAPLAYYAWTLFT